MSSISVFAASQPLANGVYAAVGTPQWWQGTPPRLLMFPPTDAPSYPSSILRAEDSAESIFSVLRMRLRFSRSSSSSPSRDIRTLDLVQLETQHVQPARTLALVSETGVLGFERAVFGMARRHLFPARRKLCSAYAVQHPFVVRGFDERLVLMLSVDVNKQLREPFEHRKRGHSAVYAALVLAVRAHLPAYDEDVLGVYADVGRDMPRPAE